MSRHVHIHIHPGGTSGGTSDRVTRDYGPGQNPASHRAGHPDKAISLAATKAAYAAHRPHAEAVIAHQKAGTKPNRTLQRKYAMTRGAFERARTAHERVHGAS